MVVGEIVQKREIVEYGCYKENMWKTLMYFYCKVRENKPESKETGSI